MYALVGRVDEARRVRKDIRRAYAEPFALATVYAALGEVEEAFQCLEQAARGHTGRLAMWVNGDPRLEALNQDRRMGDLLRRIGLGRPATQTTKK